MAAFEKLYESAFMQKLQAWGGKLQSNKALNAISSGMTSNLASGVVTLEDGSTTSALNTTWLGGPGLFTALIIPLVAVRIMKFCQEHRIAIKMPEAVPPFLSPGGVPTTRARSERRPA
ncbi:MAG: PTS transporter subunit EIIC [Atopobiaceae bacterium]|nr:PTS transporter subunit EIIC [Atopobiaceae bacterium]